MKISRVFPSVLLLVGLVAGLVACAADTRVGLPRLTAATDARQQEACRAVFPDDRKTGWQFVHSIEFAMGDGSGTTVVGVTTLTGDDIACALVTVEGLTLFEAVFPQDRSPEVRRAVPPFDGPEFAKGLIRDIRAIFQPPAGRIGIGQLADATAVCRYTEEGVGVVDVLPEVDGCWRINSYTRDLSMDRSIVGRSCRDQGAGRIPGHLELKTHGPTGYTLKMTLMSVDTFI